MGKLFFSNTNKRNDFLKIEMERYGVNNDVLIAVAFFTDEKFIQNLISKDCTVKLIIRLGFPTDYRSLKKIIGLKNVQIRYFTSTKFHPKLYIYGNDIAFLGSSNLTDGGLMGNQELNIAVDSENQSFDELKEIFYDYWEKAVVLTDEVLEKYSKIMIGFKRDFDNMEKKVIDQIGLYEYQNVTIIDKNKKKDKVNEREQELLKNYQTFLASYNILMNIYESLGKRKVPESSLPLRIEIHRFLNWVRDKKAQGDSYLLAPTRRGYELSEFIKECIEQYHMDANSSPFEDTIERYKTLNDGLGSTDKIKSLSEDELLNALSLVTAFYEHTRHSQGFIWKQDFIKDNGIDGIKNTLTFLLFGKEDFRKRIAKCISDNRYYLYHFGESCIKETYGWVNNDNTPIYNGRVQKSMQWLGFGRL